MGKENICSVVLDKMEEIRDICRKAFMRKVYLVGSAANGNFTPKSDIDFLYYFDEENKDFDDLKAYEYILYFVDSMKKIYKNRSIDVIPGDYIINDVLKENLKKTRVLIYEK